MTTRDGLRIQAPIFLNCLSRGGSNIFWNLFLSHPAACSPILETLAIFRADWRAPRRAGLWLALISGQPRFFDQWNLRPRRPLPPAAVRFIDRTLYRNKLLTLTDPVMRYKYPEEPYTAHEVERARLVAKNNNGLVFASEILRDVYTDATFFCLVRHPLPLYESHKRRHLWRSPEAFAGFYNTICGRMLADAQRCERCFITRFEDVLADPIATLRKVCGEAGLSFAEIRQVRLRSKEHFQRNGSRGATWEIGHHHWLDLAQARQFLDPNINQIHVDQLDSHERGAVLARTAPTLERLGYVD